jgi:hypothetical protein
VGIKPVPVIVRLNGSLVLIWCALNDFIAGTTLTKETREDADLVPSAALVAVTVTWFPAAGKEAGAVYVPLALMEPLDAGEMLHVTALLLELATVALNVLDAPTVRVTEEAPSDTLTGRAKALSTVDAKAANNTSRAMRECFM